MREDTTRTSVRLRIGRLTLDGFNLDRRQARAVRRAVETELTALVSAGPLPERMRSGGSARRIPGPMPVVGAWTDAADLGRQVGRAVYEAMQR